MLTYQSPQEYGKLPGSRCPANFKKRASFIITGSAGDEFREVMAEPCFESIEAHLMIEQVDTAGEFYVGNIENLTEETFASKLQHAYQMGVQLVGEIEKAQKEE